MMAYRIPDVEEPQELVAQHSSRFNLPDLPVEEATEGEATEKADSAADDKSAVGDSEKKTDSAKK